MRTKDPKYVFHISYAMEMQLKIKIYNFVNINVGQW